MLARHDGIIVLVAGAIPGEHVRARVERRTRSVIFARVEDVLEPSDARRPGVADPSCGGMDYAHIAYPGQLRCKREVLVDALQRIGRISVPIDLPIAGSPEHCLRRLRDFIDAGIDEPVLSMVGPPAMCAFGGAQLDTLYVTSIRPGGDLSDQPLAGGVFALRPGVRGIAEAFAV